MIFYRDLAQFGERQQADLSASQETQGVYIYIYMYTHTHVYTIYIYIYMNIYDKNKKYIYPDPVFWSKQTIVCNVIYMLLFIFSTQMDLALGLLASAHDLLAGLEEYKIH